MTRKDFEVIAAALKASKPNAAMDSATHWGMAQWRADVRAIAYAIAQRSFDVPAFYELCDYETTEATESDSEPGVDRSPQAEADRVDAAYERMVDERMRSGMQEGGNPHTLGSGQIGEPR